MENIIFCGGCGTFISAADISAGKASKINNIYYCQKCSTGAQARPAQARPPAPAARPAQPATARPAAMPPLERASPSGRPPQQRPAPKPTVPVARPVAPGTPAAMPVSPVQAQRPAAPRPVAPARQLDETVAINQPARPSAPPSRSGGVARPAVPQQKTQKVMPSTPPRVSQTSRIRQPPAPAGEARPLGRQVTADTGGDDIEILDDASSRRFGKAKTGKGGNKKIYLIAGAAAVVIIGIIIWSVLSGMATAAREKEEAARQAKLKKQFNAIEEVEKDFADDPQKIIDKIKELSGELKGTKYEDEIKKKEENAKALIEILDKINELEKPVETAEEVDQRIKDISKLKSNPAAATSKTADNKLRELLNDFRKKQKKLAEEEKKAHEAQEAAEKKAYEDFKAKIELLRNRRDWKEMLRECDILLGRPNGLQYQEEADKIKEEAKAALEEDQEKARKRKEWQVLNDDISKWDRSGDSKAEIYVDEDKILLKNTASAGNRGAVASIANNNEGEGWQDFTMTLEFKVVKGSFEMFLRGGFQSFNVPGLGNFSVFSGIPIPFPRKFKDEWQKYTIELKGKKLTISGTGLNEPKVSDVPEGKGGIGINVKGGDEIIVKELKVKVIE
ncbi:MAG: hypothetical protein AB1599_00095 [Planctomycetota bacterium]